MPKDVFKGAKGVVFLQAAAAAVGLTAFRGQGFVVAKVDGTWSAPAFIKLSTMGMGLSLGGAQLKLKLPDTLLLTLTAKYAPTPAFPAFIGWPNWADQA